jgi:hypothetical protein
VIRIDGIFEVPVIAVFTKYEQFRRDVRMKLEDQQGGEVGQVLLDAKLEEIFNEHYRANLRESVPCVRLESEEFVNNLGCIPLISVLQECTSLAKGLGALRFLKRLLMRSPETSFPLCCCRYRRII